MVSHARIWRLIDDLAARNGLTASGLARRAGLDPTAFNKSKRVAADGRLRWPSTESVAKVLQATRSSFEDLLIVAGVQDPVGRSHEASAPDGFAEAASEIVLAGVDAEPYLIVLDGPGAPPLYRPGDRLVLRRTTTLRLGDRVYVALRGGGRVIGELRSKVDGLRIATPGASDDVLVEPADIAEVSRILWASQ